MTDVRGEVTPGSRVLLAVVSAGAGAIHLGMVPSHWGESVAEGLGFAVTGWLQIVFAAIVLTRSSRALLWSGALLNAAAISAWIVSRTAGLPFGAHSGEAESAGFVDITCVAFESALVVACMAVALRPRIGARHARAGMAIAGIASLGVLALTTSVLASPDARNHGSPAAAAGRLTGDGHAHATPAAAPAAADDKGFSLLSNGQHDHNMTLHSLDAATKAEHERQLAVTRAVARRMPTVTAAMAAGYNRVGPYFPGIGAHFMREYGPLTTNPDGLVDDADLNNPFMLIFDGTKPTSRITGFMYYSTSPTEPAGFVGRNDTWHYHEDICIKQGPKGIDIPYGLDNSSTPEQCAKVGGGILDKTGYMLHVWSVPGFTMTNNYGGVFGESNPKLKCADGSYFMLPLDEWAAHPHNICKVQ